MRRLEQILGCTRNPLKRAEQIISMDLSQSLEAANRNTRTLHKSHMVQVEIAIFKR